MSLIYVSDGTSVMYLNNVLVLNQLKSSIKLFTSRPLWGSQFHPAVSKSALVQQCGMLIV